MVVEVFEELGALMSADPKEQMEAFFGPGYATIIMAQWLKLPWYKRAYWTIRGHNPKRILG